MGHCSGSQHTGCQLGLPPLEVKGAKEPKSNYFHTAPCPHVTLYIHVLHEWFGATLAIVNHAAGHSILLPHGIGGAVKVLSPDMSSNGV